MRLYLKWGGESRALKPFFCRGIGALKLASAGVPKGDDFYRCLRIFL